MILPEPVPAADWRAVQEFLEARGFCPGPVNGIRGPETNTALRRLAYETLGHVGVDLGDVREMQQDLNDRGISSGSIDGIYGVKTEKALEALGLKVIKARFDR